MRSKHDRTFRPCLETFEERNLPSMLSNFFSGLFGGNSPSAPAPSENLGAGQSLPVSGTVAALTNLNDLSRPASTPVPSPSSSGGGGSSVIVTTNNSSSQVGSTTSSSSTTSAAVANTLTLNPDGSVSGSFFGTTTTQTNASTAGAGPAGAVPTIVSSVGGSAQSFSTVPNPTSFGLTDPVSPVATTGSTDPGLTTPGLIAPASLRSDPGLNIAV